MARFLVNDFDAVLFRFTFPAVVVAFLVPGAAFFTVAGFRLLGLVRAAALAGLAVFLVADRPVALPARFDAGLFPTACFLVADFAARELDVLAVFRLAACAVLAGFFLALVALLGRAAPRVDVFLLVLLFAMIVFVPSNAFRVEASS